MHLVEKSTWINRPPEDAFDFHANHAKRAAWREHVSRSEMITPPNSLASQYPHLFNEVTWPWGPARASFVLLDEAPPARLIANVNIVPRIGDDWIILRLGDGSWELPGGTLEPAETYLDTVRRELREEAGAELISLRLFGAWHCFSLAEKPYRPHLPFPEYYRLVGLGEIELRGEPENPAGAEQVAAVERVSLQTAVARFRSLQRYDLAELYQLAATIS
jgi:8-oxo-dGTP diphosphatase